MSAHLHLFLAVLDNPVVSNTLKGARLMSRSLQNQTPLLLYLDHPYFVLSNTDWCALAIRRSWLELIRGTSL